MFKDKPLIIFLEITKACPLVCIHCRANAITEPLPCELSRFEIYNVLEEITRFERPYPLLVITGGDPVTRLDLFEILEYAKSLEIPTALAPAVSPKLVNEDYLRELKRLNVKALSISLDGAREETHNYVRKVGLETKFNVYELTLQLFEKLRNLGLKFQINTTVMRSNVHELPEIFKIVLNSGANAWEVFFLIKTGRGAEIEALSPEENEDVVNFLYDCLKYGITVRTVEAPFFRRTILQRRELEKYGENYVEKLRLGKLYLELKSKLQLIKDKPKVDKVDIKIVPTRDGCGIIFIEACGEIYPSGFLTYSLGNVRKHSLVKVYREHELLRKIRNLELKGRCGRCRYKNICGGSRARAYVELKDPLDEDPACIFNPEDNEFSHP